MDSRQPQEGSRTLRVLQENIRHRRSQEIHLSKIQKVHCSRHILHWSFSRGSAYFQAGSGNGRLNQRRGLSREAYLALHKRRKLQYLGNRASSGQLRTDDKEGMGGRAFDWGHVAKNGVRDPSGAADRDEQVYQHLLTVVWLIHIRPPSAGPCWWARPCDISIFPSARSCQARSPRPACRTPLVWTSWTL